MRKRCARAPFALLVLDIDRFKSFNAAYGFEEGDRLLKRFGELLSDCVAEFAPCGGLAAHVGGDDFAAVCPPAAAAALAHRLACRFDDQVRSYYPPADRRRGAVPFVTIRIGVATTETRPLTCYAQAAGIASELKDMLKTRGGALSRFALDRGSA